ncbi:MAG: hypothetical protein KDI44_12900 [Thiothrix sp.]|nr:hypothetical protein [Thiothrix sp.]HPQ96949.1 hypothetical protein [Thiolinea sp.]
MSQQPLYYGLRDVWAMVDCAWMAIKAVNASETEAAQELLLIAVNRLSEMLELVQQEVPA